MRATRRVFLTGFAGLLLTVIMFMGTAHANQSLSWEPCECPSGEQYTLTLSGLGTFAKGPDKATYSKGELVVVTFTPNSGQVFQKWTCTPASHMASDCTNPATSVFITANTTLTALTWPQNCTVHVDWDKNLGKVNGDASGSLTLTGNYGDTVGLTALPNSNIYTEWTGHLSDGSMGGPGQRYGDNVELTLLQPHVYIRACFAQIPDPPTPPIREITVALEGGSGKIYTAANFSGCFSALGWQYSTATGLGRFIHRVVPDQGYFLLGYHWTQGGQTLYCTQESIDNSVTSDTTYTATLTQGASINVEVEGQGVVTSNQFTLIYNPLPLTWAGTPTPNMPQPVINGNPVTMTPSPCPGWAFDHWEYNNGGEYVERPNPAPGLPQNLLVYMNWHEDPNYDPEISAYVRLSPTNTMFNAKAVFVKCPLDILEPNGDPVTDNHYVYDTSAQGICNVTPVASGCECSGWDWNLESIGGAIFSTVPDPPNSPTPILRYTGLPSANNQFGDKILVVRRRDGTDPVSTTVQIFFSPDEWNHPPLSTEEQATMIGAETTTGNVPNWFYYWRQTTAAYGLHRYTSGTSRVYWNTTVTPPRWEAYVGNDACQTSFKITLGLKIAPDYSWNSSGIDTYAWKTRHEASHLKDFPTWWPNGLINVLLRSPDHDGIPNEFEASLGYGYDLNEPDTNGDDITDCDDYAIRTQQHWEYYSAQEDDWSCPGQQSTL
ncbi:MAG: hypothetical protein H3C30_17470 [Candidatus Hydrogenedentes bacterium]|nr:hypothetical protein [Candidatus Hydrogenedentota bacterium]